MAGPTRSYLLPASYYPPPGFHVPQSHWWPAPGFTGNELHSHWWPAAGRSSMLRRPQDQHRGGAGWEEKASTLKRKSPDHDGDGGHKKKMRFDHYGTILDCAKPPEAHWTTLRLKGVPLDCKKDDLEQFLDDVGLAGKYNGFAVCARSVALKSKSWGHAIVNFVSNDDAAMAIQLLHSKDMECQSTNSPHTLRVDFDPAVQGLGMILQKFGTVKSGGKKMKVACRDRPVFFVDGRKEENKFVVLVAYGLIDKEDVSECGYTCPDPDSTEPLPDSSA